ncbi:MULTISPECIES: hypothetical protein [Acidobacterium]|uniref:Lipoprotein n=1 Tax=Acidobacterium capsulatum (strain ATCC 51196 / DSM 11244 / BCRC 80197 / JCM 7670 / NBRC 15755 / NCIMB 13165 / 161) TaxID=240015 RepID=C1F739_ACIC5|nr:MULTISPECIES: hypothetical protein [Acidobacterium]ACO32799.1 hypothetical protein ACP_3511 [Acidobacterium capsulatum ATCC 51196]
MPLSRRFVRSIVCQPLLVAVSLFAIVFCSTVSASTTLPDTPVGRLGKELIHHLNTDSSAQMALWLPSILSSGIPSDDRTDFIDQMALAARDS